MDSAGKPKIFSKVFEKAVQSYAPDAIDWLDPENEYKVLKSEVAKFIKASRAARVERHPPVGQGTGLRMESGKITGVPHFTQDIDIHYPA